MKFSFLELPGQPLPLARPVVPVQVEDLQDAPQLCLVDTGSTHNRFGAWLARAVGIDLSEIEPVQIALGGGLTSAFHTRADLTIAGTRYDAPVTFCDPWPYAFHLLGQEGFLRYFRLEVCAAEFWLDLTPE